MKERVEKILLELLDGSSLFPVEVGLHMNRISIFVDGDNGVNLEECAMISRRLHQRLEEQGIDTGNYIVEVSSPGLERSLSMLREYKKNVGRKLQLRNAQNKTLKGVLVYADAQKIMLSWGTAKKKLEAVDYTQIKEAKVII